MTRQEAIGALKKGQKISHDLFNADEWIQLVNGRLITEDNEDQGTFIDSFWNKNQPFEDGWNIAN